LFLSKSSLPQTGPPLSPGPGVGGQGLAGAASLIAAGNVASRVLGLARETVIADLFGASGLVSAFRVAALVPTMFYDLLVGGMVSSALVPVFSEYAERDRAALWRLASLMLSLAVVVLAILVLLVELAAPSVAFLLAPGYAAEPGLLQALTRLLRIVVPAVLFLSLSGIFTGLLHALKRFTYPAFTAAAFNATIVVVSLVGALGFGWGIEIVAVGLLGGALLQVLLQIPGLRGARLRFSLNLRHPGLPRIGLLYLPIILGLVIDQGANVLDRNLASRIAETQTIAWMQFATTLVQFPLGLVAAAISLAILPTLSRLAAEESGRSAGRLDAPRGEGRLGDTKSRGTSTGSGTQGADGLQDPIGTGSPFLAVLVSGLKMVLILIIPATAGLFILAEPLIGLLFEHGDFSAYDTGQTALALRFYLLGLTFAAIDQPLIFAYYARQNTLTPALVGLLAVGIYLIAALGPTLFRPLRMTDLVLANSLKLTGHALVMLWLVGRGRRLPGLGLGWTTLKSLLAAAVMAGAIFGLLRTLQPLLPSGPLLNEVSLVAVTGLAGLLVYSLLLLLLRVPEVKLVAGLLSGFWRRRWTNLGSDTRREV
jgi:putative peptidoglycan lipid II flippase